MNLNEVLPRALKMTGHRIKLSETFKQASHCIKSYMTTVNLILNKGKHFKKVQAMINQNFKHDFQIRFVVSF